MTASAVPVRQILAEWARVGGTRVVGAERIPTQALTLTLDKVPEAKALDIILRGAAGYVAAARAVPGSGSSNYDRILVLGYELRAGGQCRRRRPGPANRFPNGPGGRKRRNPRSSRSRMPTTHPTRRCRTRPRTHSPRRSPSPG